MTPVTATPRALPTCCMVERTPETAPACSRSTLARTVVVSGVMQRPMPAPTRTSPGTSARIVVARPLATIVKGGGPVITITPGSRRVALARLTITGGVTTHDPVRRCGADIPTCGPGYLRATALSGGIEIAAATLDGPGKGAAVTLTDAI